LAKKIERKNESWFGEEIQSRKHRKLAFADDNIDIELVKGVNIQKIIGGVRKGGAGSFGGLN